MPVQTRTRLFGLLLDAVLLLPVLLLLALR